MTLRIIQFDTVLKLNIRVGTIISDNRCNLLLGWIRYWFFLEINKLSWVRILVILIEIYTLYRLFIVILFLTELRWIEKHWLLRWRNWSFLRSRTVSCLNRSYRRVMHEVFRLNYFCFCFLLLEREEFHSCFEVLMAGNMLILTIAIINV